MGLTVDRDTPAAAVPVVNVPGKKMRSEIARTTSGFQNPEPILSGNPVSAGSKNVRISAAFQEDSERL